MKIIKKILIAAIIPIRFLITLLPGRVTGFLIDNLKIIKLNKFFLKYRVFGELSYMRFNKAYDAEPLMVDFMKSLNVDSCFWDIGACIGSFSAMAVSSGVKTVAFEANPYNIPALYENLKLNIGDGGSSTVIILPFFLHSSSSFVEVPNNHAVGNALSISLSHTNRDSLKLFSIALNIKSIMDSVELPLPTHIKIDVDGNELSVLEGIKSIMSSPELLSLHIEISENFNKINEELNKFGFKIHLNNGENYIFRRSH